MANNDNERRPSSPDLSYTQLVERGPPLGIGAGGSASIHHNGRRGFNRRINSGGVKTGNAGIITPATSMRPPAVMQTPFPAMPHTAPRTAPPAYISVPRMIDNRTIREINDYFQTPAHQQQQQVGIPMSAALQQYTTAK